jgi:hypothetical protein
MANNAEIILRNCTIVYKTCLKGHVWLTATNWVPTRCPTCEIQELRDQLRDMKEKAQA